MSLSLNAIPTIETERLILREPRLSDLPDMLSFFETSRSHMVGGPADASGVFTKLTARIGHWAVRNYGLWHIEDAQTGQFLGWAGIVNPPAWAEPELGWTVMHPAEGKGIAYEAALAARTYSAQHLGLDGVISYISPKNSRSAALAKRLGAQLESTGKLMGKSANIWRHPKQEGTT